MAITIVTRVLPGGRTHADATLLSAVVATGNGEWVDVRGLSPFSIHVQGITTATVQVRLSNAPTIPANSAHEAQAGVDIIASGIVPISTPANWAKVMVTAWTSGTINAWLSGMYS